nr:tRNA (guanosine(46)-N7)-methyltransferase TrmB [Campylobacter sp.]
MPNFIAKDIKFANLPCKVGECEFAWFARSGDESLIYTKLKDNEFFIQVKKRKDDYLVKGDKTTRPANIFVLQKALCEFRDFLAWDLIFSALNSHEKSLEKIDFLLDEDEFISNLANLKNKEIFLEIGFGSGRHLLYQAKSNPNAIVVGIEIYKPSILQVSNLAKASNLNNIILLNLDARKILSLLQDNCIDKIFLHFPIPWHKSKNRRVVSDEFALEVQRVLKKGGLFELRSDDKDYTDFSTSVFLNLDLANLQIYKNRFLEVSSKYEDRWVRQNKDIFDMIFTNSIHSNSSKISGEFVFDKPNFDQICSNLAPITHKGDDFFIHIQRIYKNEANLILKIAFGSFYKPEHIFVLINKNEIKYFIKTPLKTQPNLKAHQKLKELLFCKI